MAILAIEGHVIRGKEVIEILEMLGGKKEFVVNGNTSSKYRYYIDSNKIINVFTVGNEDLKYEYITFTLEEFLEKFPYRVGDKVYYQPIPQINSVCISEIISMRWIDGSVVYYTSNGHEVYACDLQPYKEETMEEKLEQITFDIPDGYEFFGINDDNQVVLAKKQPQYPKTYEECCKILNYIPNSYDADKILVYGYMCDELRILQKLLVCRNAYWKIAGDWKEKRKGKAMHYVIYSTLLGEIVKDAMPNCIANYLLDFPTEEMRDAFLDSEEIAQLIENCKEFL